MPRRPRASPPIFQTWRTPGRCRLFWTRSSFPTRRWSRLTVTRRRFPKSSRSSLVIAIATAQMDIAACSTVSPPTMARPERSVSRRVSLSKSCTKKGRAHPIFAIRSFAANGRASSWNRALVPGPSPPPKPRSFENRNGIKSNDEEFAQYR